MVDWYERIVVGVDGSALSNEALRWALAEARLHGAPIEVVHAWRRPDVALTRYGGVALPVISADDLEKAAHEVLWKVINEHRDETDGLEVSQTVERGHPGEVLCRRAKGASLLVVGSHGHGGFAGLLIGSVSYRVVHASPTSVAIVAHAGTPAANRVVAGFDGSVPAAAALQWAAREAAARRSTLEIVHAWQYPSSVYVGDAGGVAYGDLENDARDVMGEALAAVAAVASDLIVDTTVEHGHPVQVLLARASEASLLVLGSRGLGHVSGTLLGSVSGRVACQAPCPCVVVRED